MKGALASALRSCYAWVKSMLKQRVSDYHHNGLQHKHAMYNKVYVS